MAKSKASAASVSVTMTGAHTYQTGPSTRRTLPAGWSGPVPAEVAAEIEKAGKGAKVKPAKSAAEKPAAAPKVDEAAAAVSGDSTEAANDSTEATGGAGTAGD